MTAAVEARLRAHLAAAPGDRAAMRALGLALGARGADAEALAWFDRATADGAAPAEWQADRGTALLRLRRPAEAAAAFRSALAARPTPALHAALGDAAMAMRAYGEARDAFRAAVAAEPGFAAAWNNLAAALRELGELEEAVAASRRALAIEPGRFELWLNLATTLLAADRVADALAACARASALRPGLAAAERLAATALERLGRREEALAAWDRAVAADPRSAAPLRARAALLDRMERFDEAADTMRRVAILAPADADAHHDLGLALRRAGREAAAVTAYEAALRLAPDHAEALSGLGAALWSLRRPQPAEDAFRRAAALRPDNAGVQVHHANVLHAFGRQEEAEAAFDRIVARHPDDWGARLSAAVSRLPIVYRDEDAIARARAAYARDLRALAALPLPEAPAALADVVEALRSRQPFYLAYQGHADRDLQAVYGDLVCRAMAARFPGFAVPPPRPGLAPGERIRVGIATAYFKHHSVWNTPVHSWLADLDRGRFALHGYWLASDGDAETERARGLCDRFVEGRRSVADWARTIRDDRLHVLIVPEIGMDATTLQLAALRLAPVQATSWGHPQTSGMPTIDDFLSSDLMEPADGQDHYTERLVRLPNLSFRRMTAPVLPAIVTRAEIGVGDDEVLFWCCQSLFKYLPRHDRVFPAIAAAVPRARFVFAGYPFGGRVDATLKDRIGAAFAARGLSAERHCRFLGLLSPERFAGVTRLADVFLDSIGWSGCNSTLEAVAAGLPIVTLPGDLMRGRHTSAILRMLGVTETIAASEDEYVAIAARLGGDVALRRSLSRTIAQRRHRLQEDRAFADGLERYLVDAAGSADLGSPR
ncbi:MAG: tetratricopeptide repeat protein [Alphaproteobacteria bacterium]